MSIDRRNFLRIAAGAVGALGVGAGAIGNAGASQASSVTPGKESPIGKLKPMLQGIAPISKEERLARIEKARKLMSENKIDAILMEGGTSLSYYTGTAWATARGSSPGFFPSGASRPGSARSSRRIGPSSSSVSGPTSGPGRKTRALMRPSPDSWRTGGSGTGGSGSRSASAFSSMTASASRRRAWISSAPIR